MNLFFCCCQKPYSSHILTTDIVLQQPDLYISFVAGLEQYVHDLRQLSLHLLMTDNNLLSLPILVHSGDTDTSLQSLGGSYGPVWSSGADTILHTLQFLCSRSAACKVEHFHSNCHLYDC